MSQPLEQKINRLARRVRNRLRRAARGTSPKPPRSSNPLVPPEALHFVGEGDFIAIGDEFLRYFVDLGGLKPHEKVLDIGSGVGRMARPLTRYLSADGTYEGFDIVPAGVEWCLKAYEPFPNFNFRLANIRNKAYNPKGEVEAAGYRFEYPDDSFDFAFATSVFTHMLPDEVITYLREIARVLRPGGRCLATYFLLDAVSRAHIEKGDANLDFKYQGEGFLTIDPDAPEEAVAYPKEWVFEQNEKVGLKVSRVVHGGWSGREPEASYQDILLVEKPSAG